MEKASQDAGDVRPLAKERVPNEGFDLGEGDVGRHLDETGDENRGWRTTILPGSIS
jgi:hypothetical protein